MMIENAINTSDILINEIFFQQHKKKPSVIKTYKLIIILVM